MDPINYLAGVPQQDFLRDVQGGLQLGAGFRQVQQQQAAQELAQQQAAQYQADVAAFNASPSAQAAAALALKWPQQREAAKQAWDQQDAAMRKSQGDAALQVGFALESGNPNAAKDLLQSRITALDNSGMDSSHEKLILGAIDTHPEAVKAELLKWAAFTQDPEKFAENFGKIGQEQRAQQTAPDVARKAAADADAAVADATTKGVQAKYAEPSELLRLEGIRTDNQFKRDQTKIGYLNAQIARENNQLKRQELSLQLQKAQQEFGDKARAKVADAESAAGSIDNMLNNIDRILAVAEEKKDGKGTGKGTALLRAAAGPIDSRLPTMQGDVADLEALVETLGSQAFLSQIPNIKGMGSLSNAEGEKLQSAFQNFSLKQSDAQIIANLKEAQRLLKTGRGTISKRFGVPLGNPNTPAAAGSRPPLSSFGG